MRSEATRQSGSPATLSYSAHFDSSKCYRRTTNSFLFDSVSSIPILCPRTLGSVLYRHACFTCSLDSSSTSHLTCCSPVGILPRFICLIPFAFHEATCHKPLRRLDLISRIYPVSEFVHLHLLWRYGWKPGHLPYHSGNVALLALHLLSPTPFWSTTAPSLSPSTTPVRDTSPDHQTGALSGLPGRYRIITID